MRIESTSGALPRGLSDLRRASECEQVRNVARLEEEWRAGVETFSRTGEILLSILDDELLIGIGGLTEEQDKNVNALRMRRLYVLPARRRRGVGSMLARALAAHGFLFVPLLTVNAGSAAASAFWERLGFQPTDHANRTHQLARGQLLG